MSKLFIFSLCITAAFAAIVQADQPSSSLHSHIDGQDRAAIDSFGVRSYGHFKKMVHMKKAEGVVSIQEAISSNNTYAVGAIGQGRGEITVLNNEIWLDYGKDGLGNSVRKIPFKETAVLLVTAQVSKWHQIVTPGDLSNNRHFVEIAREEAFDFTFCIGYPGTRANLGRCQPVRFPIKMKKLATIALFVASIVITPATEAQDIPSSARSRAAIARVKPELQKEFASAGLNWGTPIFVRIFKKTKELEIWLKDRENFRLFKTYKICTYGRRSLGPKIRQGDGRAPEGFYYVGPRQMNPLSDFHLSFNLGYPNAYDRVHGRTGSALMVHGSCVSIGCYAMTDKGIEEIFALTDASLRNGQRFFRVHIFPFRMTDINLNDYKFSKWYKFWENLKEGYDFFEENGHQPPNVKVKTRRYVFEPL